MSWVRTRVLRTFINIQNGDTDKEKSDDFEWEDCRAEKT